MVMVPLTSLYNSGSGKYDETILNDLIDNKYKIGGFYGFPPQTSDCTTLHDTIDSIQKKYVDKSSLPILYSASGDNYCGKTGNWSGFPSSINLAATRNMTLVMDVARIQAYERRYHSNIALIQNYLGGISTVNGFQYFGEDPYLTGELNGCWVNCSQMSADMNGVDLSLLNNVATSVDNYPFDTKENEILYHNLLLLPFKKVTDANIPVIITSDTTTTNGIPVSMSKLYLDDNLRENGLSY
eukprot:UN29663